MSAPLATSERDEHGVVTLTLHPGDRPLVVLDSALLEAIDGELDRVAADGPPAGLVLASEGRVFIAGANLEEIMSLSDQALHEYLRYGSEVYGRFATMPCTTVAALNGAALGGGLEIAMHCDHLIAAEPPVVEGKRKSSQVGLPEAGLKICPGWGGTVLLPARMEPGEAVQMTATGRTMPIEAAHEAGLVSELVPAERLLERAKAVAAEPKHAGRTEPISIAEAARAPELDGLSKALDELPDTGPAKAVAGCVRAGLQGGWNAALQAERDALAALRSSDEGKAAIEAFFAKSAGRK